jgi:hypothetical protein
MQAVDAIYRLLTKTDAFWASVVKYLLVIL